MYSGPIKSDIHAPAGDIAKPSISDSPFQIPLENDFGKDIIQTDLIASVGGCCEADQLFRLKVIEDCAVSIGCGVVRFIADNQSKLSRIKPIQPTNNALHGCTHYLLTVAVGTCTLDAVGAIEILARLFHQFFPVTENQHSISMPRDVGKSNCFTKTGCHLLKIRAGWLRLNGFNSLGLIISPVHISSKKRGTCGTAWNTLFHGSKHCATVVLR